MTFPLDPFRRGAGAAEPATVTPSVARPRRPRKPIWSIPPLGLASAAYLVVVMLLCFLAPVISPFDPVRNDLSATYQLPSLAHWLGTDQLGRDVLSRVLHGGQDAFLAVAQALLVAAVVAIPLGVISGYIGGIFDSIVSRFSDTMMSFPNIVLILLVVAIVGPNQAIVMTAVGLVLSPSLIRVARAATIDTKNELYVAAARVFGLSGLQIMVRHLAPRITSPVVVTTAILAAQLLLIQSGLAFLGIIVQPPDPSWGGMVTEASIALRRQPWLIVPSGGVIALTVLAFVLLGDAIRDASQEGQSSTVPGLSSRRRAAQVVVPAELDAVTMSTATAPAASDPVLRVEGLSIELPLRGGWTTVVDQVSFDVRPGETLGLVGESGCGKSVTALTILGLVPGSGRVSTGAIRFGGEDLTTLSPAEYRRIRGQRIALISQEPIASLDPSFTVGSQVLEAVRQHDGGTHTEAMGRVIELLTLVGLPEPKQVAKRYPHQISGGMAQRIVIARALAGRPKLLVADEPTTALDSTVQREILFLLRRIQRDTGMAMILVTHDWGVVAETCDRAAVMYAGQVVEVAPVEQLFAAPDHPYTQALLEADPHLAKRGERIITIDGTVPAPANWPVSCRFADRCRFRTPQCAGSPIAMQSVGAGRFSRCIRVDELLANGQLGVRSDG